MSFMQQQITNKLKWWELETTHGTFFVPYEDADEDHLQDYCEGTIESVSVREGYGARLSAPGYLDCTDWSVFDTPEQAQAYLDEYYPED